MKGKPSIEIYRPPNVRSDGTANMNNMSPRLNVHAKEFTMQHELQNSKSSHTLSHYFEPIPLQHSKSSGHVLRQVLNTPHSMFPLVNAPITLPILHSASTHAILNHLPRVNFQMNNNIIQQQSPKIYNANYKENSQPPSTTNHPQNVRKSKSFSAVDAKDLATKFKTTSANNTELGEFAGEEQAYLQVALDDPNQLSPRTLMDLVKIIMERVVEGIRFSEAGAKVCMSIIEKEKTQTFLESLLNTCQQWFQERDKILRGVKIGEGTRFTAFMWFLTEMCGKFKRHKRQNQYEALKPDFVLLSILAKCCEACVTLPIKCLPETECLFFVLASIGRDLENELPSQLEQLLVSIRDGFLATAGSPVIRKTLLQLIELHASNWQLPGSSVLYYYPRIN